MSRIHQFVFAIFVFACFQTWSNPQDTDQRNPDPPAEQREMLTARILVLDPDGIPIEEAVVRPYAFRTRVEPGSHWVWAEERHGLIPEVLTNDDGIAEILYPKYVTEKLEIGTLSWNVSHPDFVPAMEDRSVDDDPAKIKLQRGFRIATTAMDASSGEKIKEDLFAIISGSWGTEAWKLHNNGMLVSPVLAKDQVLLRIIRIVPDQPHLFSDLIVVSPEDRSRVLLKDVKLSPGTRVEGKLGDTVTRPIKNGYVIAHIVHKSDDENANRRRDSWDWSGKAEIQEDGTFIFESLPRDEVIQLIPICDDWVPKHPTKESVMMHFPDDVGKLNGTMSLPQLFVLAGNSIQPILVMEPATTIRVNVVSPSGDPLPAAEVFMWPNQYFFNLGSQILGTTNSTSDIMVDSRAGKKTEWFNRQNRFSVKTDSKGEGFIENLPAGNSESLAVSHDDFEMPISGRDRIIQVNLKADQVNEVTIRMVEKGSQVLDASAFDDAAPKQDAAGDAGAEEK